MSDNVPSPCGWKTNICAFQKQFIEPSYKTINGINVAELRATFQCFLNELANDLEHMLPNDDNIGYEKMANIHHEHFLVALDTAKDHYIKFVLAACAEQKS